MWSKNRVDWRKYRDEWIMDDFVQAQATKVVEHVRGENGVAMAVLIFDHARI